MTNLEKYNKIFMVSLKKYRETKRNSYDSSDAI